LSAFKGKGQNRYSGLIILNS